MLIHQLHLYAQKQYPLLSNGFYERIAEYYHLPPLDMLTASLQKEVAWPQSSLAYEVYYLENLREDSPKSLFQVRFLPSEKRRDFINLFMSVEQSIIHTITVQFSVRGDRMNASHMLEDIKSLIHRLHLNGDDINLVVEGYMEVGILRFIRETKLSAFVWMDAPLNRYIHISEDPRKIAQARGENR